MSTKAFPPVPPRPSRSPHPRSSPNPDIPKVPLRPNSRRVDHPGSPIRDTYAPSPLNELPTGSGTRQRHSNDTSNGPGRPPSVTLPSVGQEGMEYVGLEYQNARADIRERSHSPPVEKRNVNRDLHLHAPKPSLPTSIAKAQVQAVTRTDSQQAAAAGFGKVASPDCDGTDRSRSRLVGAASSRQESSIASTDHRECLHFAEEGGISEIGLRVPLDPNSGDVQAPSPAPFGDSGQQRARSHHRHTRSGRDTSLPPGSYGLHGHGVPPSDKFERSWYEKHPDELAREEQGQYGPGLGNRRPEWALSSDDLNKIVRTSASTGLGLATHANVVGTPEEELGYIATDELASRLASAPSESRLSKGEYIRWLGRVESPLKEYVVVAVAAAADHSVLEADTQEKEEVIHIDEPLHRQHHPDGFAPAPEDHKPHGVQSLEEPGRAEEGPNDAPVLAADEIEPGSENLQPAISPTFEHASPSLKPYSRSHSLAETPPSSQSVSTDGAVPNMVRFGSRGEEREEMHTTLEDVEEYEPLFPDDDGDEAKMSASAERFKRLPEQHRFPSKDIWEDAPDSLQLEATVLTPDIPSKQADNEKEPALELPQQEPSQARSEIPPRRGSQSHLEDEKPPRAKSKQRFPSNDIWEDVPDSQRLVTTVHAPQEEAKPASPETPIKPALPTLPARPSKSISPVEGKPISPTEPRRAPTIPSRPKPIPPARPAKPSPRNSEDSLTKTISAGSTDSTAPPVVKSKPPIPSRPGGSKIAALKAGFLSDLEGRLKLGPHGPKPQEKKPDAPEEPVEKAPLSDARKGRARGPARRKPAAPAAAAAAAPAPEPVKTPASYKIQVVEPWNAWQIGGDGILVVGNSTPSKPPPAKAQSTSPPPPDLASSATIPKTQPRTIQPLAGATSDITTTIPQAPDADAEAEADVSPETASAPVTIEEGNEPTPVARDSTTTSSSPSPLRNPEPTPSTSEAPPLVADTETLEEENAATASSGALDSAAATSSSS
ncbi:hypothetical protein ACJ72_03019 [Emergomyces africanus]|uniref:Altered inheritance of mitochondria protein 21 n=1 Tax=Emergomyces africanus TaxID=1955775 RepID=A0A1B7P0S0_9EURO|nr:hypothetical protein ACJ72_03019 [Emergomyces africanus]